MGSKRASKVSGSFGRFAAGACPVAILAFGATACSRDGGSSSQSRTGVFTNLQIDRALCLVGEKPLFGPITPNRERDASLAANPCKGLRTTMADLPVFLDALPLRNKNIEGQQTFVALQGPTMPQTTTPNSGAGASAGATPGEPAMENAEMPPLGNGDTLPSNTQQDLGVTNGNDAANLIQNALSMAGSMAAKAKQDQTDASEAGKASTTALDDMKALPCAAIGEGAGCKQASIRSQLRTLASRSAAEYQTLTVDALTFPVKSGQVSLGTREDFYSKTCEGLNRSLGGKMKSTCAPPSAPAPSAPAEPGTAGEASLDPAPMALGK